MPCQFGLSVLSYLNFLHPQPICWEYMQSFPKCSVLYQCWNWHELCFHENHLNSRHLRCLHSSIHSFRNYLLKAYYVPFPFLCYMLRKEQEEYKSFPWTLFLGVPNLLFDFKITCEKGWQDYSVNQLCSLAQDNITWQYWNLSLTITSGIVNLLFEYFWRWIQ